MIRLENLTKIFETREGRAVAADNVSMDVREGEICILLGPSGCGKTTTLKMINRLIPPTSGKRSDENTAEIQTLMRISNAVFCWTKKNKKQSKIITTQISHT